MMVASLRPLLVAAFICLVGTVTVVSAQTPLRGVEGRVVILDASGSMRQSSFASSPSGRWDQALLSLSELMRQLRARDDGVQTIFQIFGDRYAWSDVQGKYRSPASYPATGPMCQDVEWRTGFERVTQRVADRIMEMARRASPSGMTPIPLALDRALQMLDPEHGGTIILVSDMDNPNCLAPGQTLCNAIERQLERFRAPDGRMLVEFRVLATPVAGISTSLAACAPTTNVALSTTNPDHEAAVAELLGGFDVQVALRVNGVNNLDPSGIDPAGISISVFEANTGRQVASGPPGRLTLRPGPYDFRAVTPAGSWSAIANVTAPGQSVVIGVDGGTLSLTAVDAAGASVRRLDTVEILRADGTPVWRGQAQALPLQVELGDGSYEIRATARALGAAGTRIPVALASFANAVLQFGPRRSVSEVTFHVTIPAPTLDVARPFAPEVTLSGGNLPSARSLHPGANAIDLEPGVYEIDIRSANPHRMQIVIPPGAMPHEVDLRVPPGRFSARTTVSGGQFELQDSAGIPLFSFDNAFIEHSLPDGRYRLLFRSGDGAAARTQEFSLGAGDVVALEF